jgi:hypothetical protein
LSHRFVLRGSGVARVTAAGIADAEHRLEKVAERRAPGCQLTVMAVSREASGALTEEYRIGYRLRLECDAGGESIEDARRAAFRGARERFAGTELWMTAWERADLRAEPPEGR